MVLPSAGVGYPRLLNMEKIYVRIIVKNLFFDLIKEILIEDNLCGRQRIAAEDKSVLRHDQAGDERIIA